MMSNSTNVMVQSPTPRREDAVPVACIELDRFCGSCGYNLRTLPVYLDARTNIPVVRCTECGRFQPANDGATALRPWLSRATSLLIVVWILGLAWAFFGLGMAEGAISYGTLDELTWPEGYESRRVNNVTTIVWNSTPGPLKVRETDPETKLFIAVIYLTSLATAFVGGMLAVVVFPHWRRVGYVGLIVAIPVLAGAIVAVIWREEAPHLLAWGLGYTAAHTGTQILGGALGIAFGRPLARTIVRVFLSPSFRPKLAYLWLADGKVVPS